VALIVTKDCDRDHSGIHGPLTKLMRELVSGIEGDAVVGTNLKRTKHNLNEEHLLRIHKLHLGLYARVAEDLGVSPSYVSLVANGMRTSDRIRRVLVQQIARIHNGFSKN